MKARKLLAAAALGFSALLAASQSSAQGFYAGGSFGQSDYDDGNAVPALITSGTVDGSDTGFKFFGGYQFSPNLGVEVAYVDLGKATYSGSFLGDSVTGGKIETTGFNVSAVGTLPVNPSFSLFAKVGLFLWDAEASDVTAGVPFSASDDDMDVSFGIGAAYNVTSTFSIRAEWEQFEAVDSISLLSVGVAFKF